MPRTACEGSKQLSKYCRYASLILLLSHHGSGYCSTFCQCAPPSIPYDVRLFQPRKHLFWHAIDRTFPLMMIRILLYNYKPSKSGTFQTPNCELEACIGIELFRLLFKLDFSKSEFILIIVCIMRIIQNSHPPFSYVTWQCT